MPPKRKRTIEPSVTTPSLPNRSFHSGMAGSSQSATAYVPDTAAPSRKKRKTKAEQVDEAGNPGAQPKKRPARKRNVLPKTTAERVNRVFQQRFYLLDRTREGNKLSEEFSVLGSTGNVYTVKIGPLPSCDCPDGTKGNTCKHILFVFLKVLTVPSSSNLYYQKGLLTTELEQIFSNAPPNPRDLATNNVRQAYQAATGKSTTASQSSTSGDSSGSKESNKKIPQTEDDCCAVCYETFEPGKTEGLEFCKTCGNPLHRDCFRTWATQCKGPLTCVTCRSPWVDADGNSSDGGKVDSSEGYVNLAKQAGLSLVRDTSSYYHGPGSRFGRGGSYYL